VLDGMRGRNASVQIKTIAVAKSRQQQGVGLNMLAEIVRNYKKVAAVVGEYSLKTQKFFRACGFECVKIEKGKYRYQVQGVSGKKEWKVFDGYRFEIES
jgi:N-acetylglutamate synthase-like GNAT family acetyltransferase